MTFNIGKEIEGVAAKVPSLCLRYKEYNTGSLFFSGATSLQSSTTGGHSAIGATLSVSMIRLSPYRCYPSTIKYRCPSPMTISCLELYHSYLLCSTIENCSRIFAATHSDVEPDSFPPYTSVHALTVLKAWQELTWNDAGLPPPCAYVYTAA